MTTLFGISNCDTVRKAKKWLEAQNISFEFHDFRKNGIDAPWLENVENHIGWEILLNKRGTTFRQLDESQKSDLTREKAIALMLAHPAMIKRPILIHGDTYLCGFKDAQYQEIFAS